MRRQKIFISCSSLMLTLAAMLLTALGAAGQETVPGQILVRYRPGVLASTGANFQPNRAQAARPEALGKLDARFGLKHARRLGFDSPGRMAKSAQAGKPAPARPALARAERATKRLAQSIQVLEFAPDANLHEILQAYRANPLVLAAEPNYTYRLCATPSDPYYAASQADDFALVGLPTAWDTQTGSASIIVAVLDSGCDILHEDWRRRSRRCTGILSPTRPT